MTAGTVFPKAGGFRRLTAPRFYRSCAGALTDGFRPQSGLVQRELCMPPIGGYILIARRAIPQPFEPSEPFEPFEPSRRRRVQWRHLNPRLKGPSPPSSQPAAAGGHNLHPRRDWPPSPLNPLNPLNLLNPAPRSGAYFHISPSTSCPSNGRELVNCHSMASLISQVLPHWAHQRGVPSGRAGR